MALVGRPILWLTAGGLLLYPSLGLAFYRAQWSWHPTSLLGALALLLVATMFISFCTKRW